MVKHIILWNLKDDFNTDTIKRDMKKSLEALVGVVPGLITMQIEIDPMPSSNADVMLYSEFDDEQALHEYAVHPAHVRVADSKVRPFTRTRTVMDYIVES